MTRGVKKPPKGHKPKQPWLLRTTYLVDGDIFVERFRHTVVSGQDAPILTGTEVRAVGRLHVRRYNGRTMFHISLDEPPYHTMRDALAELEERIQYVDEP